MDFQYICFAPDSFEYPQCFVLNNLIFFLCSLMVINREKICNIKVSNFILKNYKDYKLFNTQNHPNGILGSYVAKKICELLNVEFTDLNIFSQSNISILDLKYDIPDSIYSKRELSLKYTINDNTEYYKQLIIKVYHDTSIIKYKYAIG